ncbi:MAG: toll/interleukin-1 receptor domain-containing protein [Chloroflexota bacterium]
MANPEHVQLVREGSEAIARWQTLHPEEHLDLAGANLIWSKLTKANLSGANLSGANLSCSDLSWADLSGADLTGADLLSADMTWAYLIRANLSCANLYLAKLFGVDLTEANLSQARCGSTNLANCNLGECRGLGLVVHESPSSIGIDTMIRSGGNIPRAFLLGAGVPREILDALLPLVSGERRYPRCLIRYTSADEDFATRLHRDLEAEGVPCWKYDEDAVAAVLAKPDRAFQDNDKMVTICSQRSLQKDGVPREIERALQKEAALKAENMRRKSEGEKQGEKPDLLDEDVLVPVRLDDYVLNEWQHPRKADVLATHVLDFSGWQDGAKYQETFNRLLNALDPQTWGPALPQTEGPI